MSICIITGSSRGIGKEIAKALALNHQCKVVLTATKENLLKDGNYIHIHPLVVDHINKRGGEASYIIGDVSNYSDCQKIVNFTLEKYNRIDIVVNNAGILDQTPISKLNPELIQQHFQVNLFAPIYLTQLTIEHVRQHKGKYFFTSSGCAVKQVKDWSLYCTTKAGLNQFAACLALEQPEIISVALRPGLVRTDMLATFTSIESILEPEFVGEKFAKFMVNCTKEVSGKFISVHDLE